MAGRRLSLPLAAALALAACEAPAPVKPPPDPRPPVRSARPAPPPPVASPESIALASHYTAVERTLDARGLLRTDPGDVSALTPDQLTRIFVQVALFGEYDERGPVLVQRRTATRLHRWIEPVRIEMVFGPGVPAAERARDLRAVDALISDLAAATGHPVVRVASGGNFTVFVMGEDDRLETIRGMKDRMPELGPPQLERLVNLPRTTYCLVFSSDPRNDGVIRRAAALVRAEQPALMRLACLHEEIAQGLGLPNDSPEARPSIFNDDDEFAELTALDRHLLSILYHPRLAPGMDAVTAAPIVAGIAARQLAAPPATPTDGAI